MLQVRDQLWGKGCDVDKNVCNSHLEKRNLGWKDCRAPWVPRRVETAHLQGCCHRAGLCGLSQIPQNLVHVHVEKWQGGGQGVKDTVQGMADV